MSFRVGKEREGEKGALVLAIAIVGKGRRRFLSLPSLLTVRASRRRRACSWLDPGEYVACPGRDGQEKETRESKRAKEGETEERESAREQNEFWLEPGGAFEKRSLSFEEKK